MKANQFGWPFILLVIIYFQCLLNSKLFLCLQHEKHPNPTKFFDLFYIKSTK